MLKNLDPILGPDLLHILRAMGHGDEIAIVDANYPASSAGPQVVRLDGLEATRVLDAILSVMPLDDFVAEAAWYMQPVDDPGRMEPVTEAFATVIGRHEPAARMAALERFAFYDRVRAAFALVATGERRLYGNILLRKGIVRPDA